MREYEHELVRIIRESTDPAKTMVMTADIMCRLIAGADKHRIGLSYGINLEEVTSE